MPASVLINCRDRLSSLLELIHWLEGVGVDDLPPGETFYQARAANQTEDSPHASHWIRSELPEAMQNVLEHRRRSSASRRYAGAKDRLRWWLRDHSRLERGVAPRQ